MNGMLYVRGDQEDYDAWERRGNPGNVAPRHHPILWLMILAHETQKNVDPRRNLLLKGGVGGMCFPSSKPPRTN